MDGLRRRFRRVRAQSSVLGVVLILGLTLTVASGIVVLGSAVLDDSQQQSQVGQSEQALTQFDSRAAQVALGESSTQTVRVGRSNGDYRIRPDAGHVTITHVNYTESQDVKNETIHEGPLGALVYTQGDTEIAYQGGGVWRRDGDGGATMISPPEFHYRRATLTFPIVRVLGDGAASGDVTARVERTQPPRDVFPDRSASYDETGDPYLNPVENGTMMVTVQSDYCQGWQRYFDARTEGNVTDCNEDGEVQAEIVSIGTQGEFEIANQPQLRIRGVEDLLDLELVFRDSSEQNSEFNNFEWSMAAEEGDQQLEFYLHNEDKNVKCDDPDKDTANVTVEIYYSDDGGDTYSTWVNNDTREDFQVECDADGQVLEVDLLSDAPMDHIESDVYSSSGGGNGIPVFAGDADTFNETVPSGMEDPETTGNVTEHYMAEVGDADFDIQEQNMAGIGSDSKGNIEYEGSGRVITFLHITENEIEIDLR